MKYSTFKNCALAFSSVVTHLQSSHQVGAVILTSRWGFSGVSLHWIAQCLKKKKKKKIKRKGKKMSKCPEQHTYSYCCASGDCRSLRRSQPCGANTPAPHHLLLPPGRWPWPRPGCHSPVSVTSPLSRTHTEGNISVQVSK